MHVSFKNKCLVSLVLILASASFGDLLATPKTWTKDTNGRVLVYRAEPSKLEAVGLGFTTALGLSCGGFGFLIPNKPLGERTIVVLFGACIAGFGAYGLTQWYHDYDSLYKPLIIMDKHGITYEGKDKVLWKRVCGYECIKHTVYRDGHTYHDYYLEISTDVDKLQIHENKISITLKMLHKLVDEAYKSYQESEKEKITA